MNEDLLLIHTDAYKDWVLDASHPTQGRRFTNARTMIHTLALDWGATLRELEPTTLATKAQLARIHTTEYIDEVLDSHTSNEWAGQRPDLSYLAALMCGGTLQAAELLHLGAAKTIVHLPGAKHHAMRDHSSGFCVFNDFALAAHTLTDLGHRVAILDIDAHRGDGVEALTMDNPDILTFSIHDESIFPWSPGTDVPRLHIYNRPLPANSDGKPMLMEVNNFIALAKTFDATAILITCGADGHTSDPLSTLRYSELQYRAAARKLRHAFPTTPMLMGGAGGYQPDRATPRVWAAFAMTLAGGRSPQRRRRDDANLQSSSGQRRHFSLQGHDLDDDAVVDQLARDIWANFMTTEGESWTD